MGNRSPEVKQKIIDFVNQFYRENHRTPSLSQIGKHISMTKVSALYYLNEMTEEGALNYNGQTIVTPFIKEKQSGCRRIPLLRDISCGLPKAPGQPFDDYMDLSVSITGEGGTLYLLQADGDSMIGAGIDDGDLVLVRAADTANPGDIVVALKGEEGGTLKRLKQDAEGRCYLHPENPKYPDFYPDNGVIIIQGVAFKVIKDV